MEAAGKILYERVLPPVLRQAICNACGCRGEIEVRYVAANNGIGLQCGGCGSKQPVQGLGPFLPQESKRRPNAIAALKREAEARCYLCRLAEDQLEAIGLGLQAHHALPHVIGGDEGPQIPLCTLCHEIARALQHAAGRRCLKEGA